MGKNEEISNIFELTIVIDDDNVINYLKGFSEDLWPQKVMEALKVGVIAIQSASPTLDTTVVNEKFNDIQNHITLDLVEFKSNFECKLREYFDTETGQVDRKLSDFFGENGQLNTFFEQYFGSETGKVLQLLKDQVGKDSEFAKKIDPTNKDSIISQIQTTVEQIVTTKIQQIADEFTLDKEDSALTRLKKGIMEEIILLKTNFDQFKAELSTALNTQSLISEIKDKSAIKGHDFEAVLMEHLSVLSRDLEDDLEPVGSKPGKMGHSKKGDFIITLGLSSGAPNKKIVLEAKKDETYTKDFQKCKDELLSAKENRDAQIGIFVFAKGYQPEQVGDFFRVGNDFYVIVDEDDLENGKVPIYLDASIKIARMLLIVEERQTKGPSFDMEKIKQNLDGLLIDIEKIQDISDTANKITKNAQSIQKSADENAKRALHKIDEIYMCLALEKPS
jgi:hypothetical protein